MTQREGTTDVERLREKVGMSRPPHRFSYGRILVTTAQRRRIQISELRCYQRMTEHSCAAGNRWQRSQLAFSRAEHVPVTQSNGCRRAALGWCKVRAQMVSNMVPKSSSLLLSHPTIQWVSPRAMMYNCISFRPVSWGVGRLFAAPLQASECCLHASSTTFLLLFNDQTLLVFCSHFKLLSRAELMPLLHTTDC